MEGDSTVGSRAYGSKVAKLATDMHPGTIDDHPEQHAFIMLGHETLFLSHLTMYGMEEHNFQLVLEARLPPEAMRKYTEDRARHPHNTYFLGNSPEDLLTVPEMHSGTRPSFTCDIFRGIPQLKEYDGWPWATQPPLVRGVLLTIERIVYFRHLSLTFKPPTNLTYALFGKGREAHITNYQTKSPDFDQVVSLSEPPAWLSAAQLQSGVHVSIATPTGGLVCHDPLLASDNQLTVKYRGEMPDRMIMLGYRHWFCTKVANLPNPDPCGEYSIFCGTPP
jgi:hypothetical protein